MKTFLAIIGGVVVFILSPIWSGYVLSVVWGWFVVPALHAPHISIALAIGLAIVVRLVTSTYEPTEEGKEKSTFIGVMGFAFFYPLLALGFGAIVHAFVA